MHGMTSSPHLDCTSNKSLPFHIYLQKISLPWAPPTDPGLHQTDTNNNSIPEGASNNISEVGSRPTSSSGTEAAGAMPVGSVQGQNPTQGLVHWMSAVMAEHMTSSNTHHDPTVGMHYMWNGGVDVSAPIFTCVLGLSLFIPKRRQHVTERVGMSCYVRRVASPLAVKGSGIFLSTDIHS